MSERRRGERPNVRTAQRLATAARGEWQQGARERMIHRGSLLRQLFTLITLMKHLISPRVLQAGGVWPVRPLTSGSPPRPTPSLIIPPPPPLFIPRILPTGRRTNAAAPRARKPVCTCARTGDRPLLPGAPRVRLYLALKTPLP